MKHNYLSNTPLDEAKSKYYSLIGEKGFCSGTESVPSGSSCGRVLADAVYAKICSPHYNASAMDGIAVLASDTYGAAEQNPLTLSAGQYTEVDTGDALPDGCDAVIMVEDVSENTDGSVTIIAPVHPWQNVRQVGEDICMGDMIAVSGTRVTPSLCGAFLAAGISCVNVVRKPVFGIIPTGDEIVAPKENPDKGEIIEFNSSIFSAMLGEWNAESRVYDIVPDKKNVLTSALERAVSECDAVLILAGSSAGRDDYTSEIISSLGEVCVHGIAVKPGKPAILGVIGSKPVIGLPGYPVSAIVIMEEIVRGTVDIWYNSVQKQCRYVSAVLGKRTVTSLKYREFVRVSLGNVGGRLTAVPLPRGAGVITSFTKADGILEIPQNCEGIEAGETVEVRLLRDIESIEKSLIITGSHDPIIDEIADILRKNGTGIGVTSSHVGSMGAINAVKAKQAHLGAIHLLDEESGEYNTAYVNKYFPDGGVRIVKGVNRIQGLMVRKGNPLGIKSFEDIASCRYVNRQRGSGTRILCDYLVKKYGMDFRSIQGYTNEEFTHTAVAALVSAGNADAGLGIYSAAKMYGLDFIPVCNEEYDFLIDEEYIDSPSVKEFLKVLESKEFAARIEEMGGYSKG